MPCRLLRYFTFVFVLFVIAACTPEQPLPTLVPTDTPVQATATATAAPTETPTVTPSLTPDIPETTAKNPLQQAFMRYVHAAPDYGAVDIFLDDLSVTGGFSYTQISGQGGITEGTYTLRILSAETDTSGTLILEQPITITAGAAHVFVFTGTLETPALTTLVKDTTPLRAEQSRFTVYNAIPRGPAITVETSETELTSPLDFGVLSSPVIVPEGRDVLELRAGVESLHSFDFRFRDYDSYLLIVTGQPENLAELEILTLVSRVNGLTDLRFVTAVDGVDGVDLYLDGEIFLQDMGYLSNTNFMEMEARAYDLTVIPAGENLSAVEPLFQTQVGPREETRQTLMFTGAAPDIRLLNLEFDDAPLLPGQARFTFVNPLSDAPRVYLQTERNGDFSLFSGQAEQNVLVEAVPQSFTWSLQERDELVGDPLEIADINEITEGENYLYILDGQGYTDSPVLLTATGELAEAPADPDNPNAVEEDEILSAPQIRLVNAVEQQDINYRIDDVLVVSNLAPGTGNPFLTLTEGDHIITAHDSGTQQLLARDVLAFEPGTINSIYVSRVGDDFEIFTVEDLWLNSETLPVLRAVNLSPIGTEMGLLHAPAAPALNITTVPETLEPQLGEDGQPIPVELDDFGIPLPTPGPTPITRRSIPFGLNSFVERVPARDISVPREFNASTPQRDLYITDVDEAGIICTLPGVTLMPGVRYDVVAYENALTTVVGCFLIPYPAS